VHRTQKFDVRLKWPNDIYHGPSTTKIGGVLCQSTLIGREATLIIGRGLALAPNGRSHLPVVPGIGINVENSQPTTCLRDIQAREGRDPAVFSRELLLARFLEYFEGFMTTLERDGFKPFLGAYLRNWLHRLRARPSQ
jgi:biotin--protein ligase